MRTIEQPTNIWSRDIVDDVNHYGCGATLRINALDVQVENIEGTLFTYVVCQNCLNVIEVNDVPPRVQKLIDSLG